MRIAEGSGGKSNTEHGREPLKAPLRRKRAANVEASKVVRNVYLFVSM